MAEDVAQTATRSGWLTREKLVLAVGVPVCLALLSATLTWWINRPTTDVEFVALQVVPGVDAGESVSENGEFEMVPPKLQVALRNVGDQVSVISGVEVTILDYIHLPQCQPGAGPMAVSQQYDLTLPIDPAPGEVITVDVAQDVPPNQADRFELAVQVEDPDAQGLFLYQLGVVLVRDGSARMDAGVAIVAAPDFYNPLYEGALEEPGSIGACHRQTAVDYQRFLAWEGVRPSEYAE